METLPTCPHCRSYDVRVLTRTDDMHSYRCHDCQHVFHVRTAPPTQANEQAQGKLVEASAPKKR
jgi:transposase-like protein